MEKCLTENFILKHGLNYFGPKDLIYLDMRGDQDVALHSSWDTFAPDWEKRNKQEKKEAEAAAKAAKKAAKAAAAGDDEGEGDDGGDEGAGDEDADE